MAKNRLENTAGVDVVSQNKWVKPAGFMDAFVSGKRRNIGILIATLGFQGCASYGSYHGGSFIQPEHLPHSQHSPASQDSRGWTSHPQRPSYQAASQPTQQPSHFNNDNNTAPRHKYPQRQHQAPSRYEYHQSQLQPQHQAPPRHRYYQPQTQHQAPSEKKDLFSKILTSFGDTFSGDHKVRRRSPSAITSEYLYNRLKEDHASCENGDHHCYGTEGISIQQISRATHGCVQKGLLLSTKAYQPTGDLLTHGYGNGLKRQSRGVERRETSDEIFLPCNGSIVPSSDADFKRITATIRDAIAHPNPSAKWRSEQFYSTADPAYFRKYGARAANQSQRLELQALQLTIKRQEAALERSEWQHKFSNKVTQSEQEAAKRALTLENISSRNDFNDEREFLQTHKQVIGSDGHTIWVPRR